MVEEVFMIFRGIIVDLLVKAMPELYMDYIYVQGDGIDYYMRYHEYTSCLHQKYMFFLEVPNWKSNPILFQTEWL